MSAIGRTAARRRSRISLSCVAGTTARCTRKVIRSIDSPTGHCNFRRPDGRLLPEVPTPSAVPADPVQALRARHDAQGLRLHARTTCPGWLGERLDVVWAIDVLHPLATRRAGSVLSPAERGSPAPSPSAAVVPATEPPPISSRRHGAQGEALTAKAAEAFRIAESVDKPAASAPAPVPGISRRRRSDISVHNGRTLSSDLLLARGFAHPGERWRPFSG